MELWQYNETGCVEDLSIDEVGTDWKRGDQLDESEQALERLKHALAGKVG